MNYSPRYKTVYGLLFPYENLLLDIFLLAGGVGLLALSANIRIPLWPVPITLQTSVVFLIAFFFGSKKGFLTIMSYLLLGIVGVGVFAGYKSGVSSIVGPTGGYLAGFLFMCPVVGLLIENGLGRNWKSVLTCMIIAEAVLYGFGLTWLWLYLGKTSLLKLLSVGLFPFLVGDSLKALLCIGLFPYLFQGEKRLKD